MKILIAEDTEDARIILRTTLKAAGYDVRDAPNGAAALKMAKEDPPDMIISDIMMPEMDGFELCRRIKTDDLLRMVPVIFYTATYTDKKAENLAMSLGASRFIVKPMDIKDFLEVISSVIDELKDKRLSVPASVQASDSELTRMQVDILAKKLDKKVSELEEEKIELKEAFKEISRLKEQLEAENIYLREEVKLQHEHGEIVGESDAIKETLKLVEQVAGTDSTVLILGETGTGKELVAQSIHDLSRRKDRPMVKINCAAIPSTLIESELFGREKGAYTGALTTQVGRFEVANGSSLFLDEIGELSYELQAKLLRVIQDGSLERLGSTKTIKVDVRIIAATNRDLEQAMVDGKFRSDLYYRLNVFPVFVPPLRERREDIKTLVRSFVREFEQTMGKRIKSIPRRDVQALQSYSWPGNVRELRNLIERSMILAKNSTLHIEMPLMSESGKSRNRTLDEIQKDHIISVLERTEWRVRGENGAAKILGLKPTTLDSRMKKLGIKRQD